MIRNMYHKIHRWVRHLRLTDIFSILCKEILLNTLNELITINHKRKLCLTGYTICLKNLSFLLLFCYKKNIILIKIVFNTF